MTKTALKSCVWKTLFWIIFAVALYFCFAVLFPLDVKTAAMLWIGTIAGALSLLFATLKIYTISVENSGDDNMKKIAGHIFKGAMAFLRREYKILFWFVLLIFALLYRFIDLQTAICFVCGAVCSATAGFVGMFVSTKSNSRTTEAAKKSLNKAFKIAFSGGAVMGLTVVGLGLLGLSVLYIIFKDPEIINGFGLGASSIALFARVGGGIYTKAADVGADLVGKVEAGIPEDDYRNPAVIADNVGDNVGDVAGMGADLFESYVGSIIAAITLGAICLNLQGAFLPILVAAAGIFASIFAVNFVRTGENSDPMAALQRGTVVAMAILIAASYFIIKFFLPDFMGVFWSILTGIITGSLIGFLTEYYTSYDYNPTKSIANATKTGPATTIIAGLGVGMVSTFLPLILICIAIVLSFILAGGLNAYTLGIYGVSMAAVGMLSVVGMIVAVDAYGPISDNAGGIAQMANLEGEVRERTDKLDSVGNTTAAIGKGFAIGSAALTAIALLSAFATVVELDKVDILNPFVNSGLLFGAVLPFLFCALTMGAVGRAAQKMVDEVRRQFREIRGIMEGKCEPQYAKCVDISARSAIYEMFLPGLIAIAAPLVVGLGVAVFTDKATGAQTLAGMLMGAIASGVCLAIMMANSGGAWDNAKKYIESGYLGGKGTKEHAAAVVGDTVGDPFKDTSGPSLNILIKLMSIVALVCATLFI
mgnify:CR=1 FL=1